MWLRLLFEVVLSVHDYDCGDDTTSMIYNRFGAPDPNTTLARPIIGPCLYVLGELAVTVAAAGPATWKKEALKMASSGAVLVYVVMHVVYICLADNYLHYKDKFSFHMSHGMNVLTWLVCSVYYLWKSDRR